MRRSFGVVLTAFVIAGCTGREHQAISWRGMRVDADPEFTVKDRDTVLSVKIEPANDRRRYGSILFKWMGPAVRPHFEVGRDNCLRGMKYVCHLDSTSISPAECYSVENGSLADSDYTSTGNCALRDRTIQARYTCMNDDCRRVRLIIARTFGSVDSGSVGDPASRQR